jgi:hypothetical protein
MRKMSLIYRNKITHTYIFRFVANEKMTEMSNLSMLANCDSYQIGMYVCI